MERQQRVLFHAQLLWSSQAAYELVRLVNESFVVWYDGDITTWNPKQPLKKMFFGDF